MATESEMETYRKVLREAWKDGKLSDEEITLLNTLKTASGITDEEHSEMEKEIQLEAYMNAVARAWMDGVLTPGEASALDELRKAFNISSEEHVKIDRKIREQIRELNNLEKDMNAPSARNVDIIASIKPRVAHKEDLNQLTHVREERMDRLRKIHKGLGSANKCPICGGTGKCTICDGAGVCEICGGSGMIGDKECINCLGSGKCTYCQGSGICPACNGTGTI